MLCFRMLRFLVLFPSLVLIGCAASTFEITNAPPDSRGLNKSFYPASDNAPIISVVEVKIKDEDASGELDERLTRKLKDTGLYSAVSHGRSSAKSGAPNVAVALNAAEDVDNYYFHNLSGSYWSGRSLFILAPLISKKKGYSTTHNLRVIWPNTQEIQYTASCSGMARGSFSISSETIEKMVAAVDEACLTSVINQMDVDYPKMITKSE